MTAHLDIIYSTVEEDLGKYNIITYTYTIYIHKSFGLFVLAI